MKLERSQVLTLGWGGPKIGDIRPVVQGLESVGQVSSPPTIVEYLAQFISLINLAGIPALPAKEQVQKAIETWQWLVEESLFFGEWENLTQGDSKTPYAKRLNISFKCRYFGGPFSGKQIEILTGSIANLLSKNLAN